MYVLAVFKTTGRGFLFVVGTRIDDAMLEFVKDV